MDGAHLFLLLVILAPTVVAWSRLEEMLKDVVVDVGKKGWR